MSGVIPIEPGDPLQRIEIVLGDAPYVLRVRWNTRDVARDDAPGCWYLDIFESDGKTPVATSIRIVLGALLGKSSTHSLFSGGIFAVDDSGSGEEAGLDDLGGRVTLWYLEPEDLFLSAQPVLEPPTP